MFKGIFNLEPDFKQDGSQFDHLFQDGEAIPERTLTECLDPCPSIHHFWRITMTKNVGAIDRTLRIVIGLALIAGAATSTIGLWGYLGVVPLLTGLIGWCPPYAMLGFNTCSMKK